LEKKKTKQKVFSTSAPDAVLDPYKFQVTTVSMARFKNKKVFFYFENVIAFKKKNHLKPVGD
jgi:hypothetical protein